MSEEISGALALLVESVICFCLQELETVERMGKIGKYLGELLTGWAILMSTASVGLVFMSLLFPNKIAPAWCIWLGAAFCFLVANFIVWNRKYEQTQQAEERIRQLTAREIIISGVVYPPQSNIAPTGANGLEYRIDIYNPSSNLSLHDSEVRVIQIEPDVPELRLPVWLQQMHDHGSTKQTTFQLNPQDHKYIDLALNWSDAEGITICHTVCGVLSRIPSGDYILTVAARANDAKGDTKRFRVWDTDGTLRCEMLGRSTGSIPNSH
jgi:hypothetical protein